MYGGGVCGENMDYGYVRMERIMKMLGLRDYGNVRMERYGRVSEVSRKNKKRGLLSSQMTTSHDNTR